MRCSLGGGSFSMSNTKICTICNSAKHINEFYIKSYKSTQTRPECKVCSRMNNKNRYIKEYNTIQCRKWAENNREKSRLIKQKHQKTNLNCKLRMALRNRLYYILTGKTKEISAVRHLGCTLESLKSHLESKFVEGMTWQNYGKWHIDHIRPLSSFDLNKTNQLKKAVHYTNLQPLWAIDNRKKGAKWKN